MPHRNPQVIETMKQTVETVTLPTGISVSGMAFMGLQLSDWVFVGTAFLLICNLFLTIPKVVKAIRSVFTDAKP